MRRRVSFWPCESINYGKPGFAHTSYLIIHPQPAGATSCVEPFHSIDAVATAKAASRGTETGGRRKSFWGRRPAMSWLNIAVLCFPPPGLGINNGRILDTYSPFRWFRRWTLPKILRISWFPPAKARTAVPVISICRLNQLYATLIGASMSNKVQGRT